MRLRGIGIVGYAAVFPVAAALLAVLFHRTAPAERGRRARRRRRGE